MANPYSGRAVPIGGPATDIIPVAPNDAADLPTPALALYIETGGWIEVETVSGDAPRVIAVSDVSLLPVAVRRVRAAGTTASGIHALVLR
ncbi:MAG: hypothetical protein AAF763_10865 [Pseudomonadota bacterium]